MQIPSNEISNKMSHAVIKAMKQYFQKKFPYKSEHNYTKEQKIALERKFKKWSVFSRVLVVSLFFVLPVAYGWGFYKIYYYVYVHIISTKGIFFPVDWMAFCLPGLFLSLCTISYLPDWVQRMFMGVNYKIFADYFNDKEGYDNHRAFLLISLICTFPLAITLLFIYTSGIVVYPDKFTVKMFYAIKSDTHPFNTIKKITYCANFLDRQGEKIGRAHYKFTFNDNTTFTTNWFFHSLESTKPFIDIVSKNNIPIDSLDVDNN